VLLAAGGAYLLYKLLKELNIEKTGVVSEIIPKVVSGKTKIETKKWRRCKGCDRIDKTTVLGNGWIWCSRNGHEYQLDHMCEYI
jgi:hypothetical protein